MPQLTFITTCRGRLESLQQSLPTFVAQPDTDCIVVDYGCPQNTMGWVNEHFPQVQVVQVTDRPRFELAPARDLGAAAATTPWLCFADADVCLHSSFGDVVEPLLAPGRYYRPQPRVKELFGTCVCHRDDFFAVEGYDDVLQGWGKEDGDLYMRLRMKGVQPDSFPGDVLQPLMHNDSARVEHYEVKDQWLSTSANHVYCLAKWDLMRLSGRNLARDLRQRLYEQFHKAIIEAHADGEPLEMGVPVYRDNTWNCGPVEVRLVYRLRSPSGNAADPAKPADDDDT